MLGALLSKSLILFLLFISIITASCALGNETDQISLLKLKESISDDPFRVMTSWNSSNHFCNWHGVTCGNRHQRVIELNLTRYHLRGFIPPHVGNLSFLRYLNLGGNNFYNEVPKELGRLFRLRYLNFLNNTLGGKFPINLVNCSQLNVMGLEGNHFTGPIPNEIGLLGKLEWLAIAKNNFTGQIPSSIGNISSLISLSLAYNELEGNIPKEIGHLKYLKFLYLGPNKLSGTLPSSLYNLSSLIECQVTANQIHGHLLANMFLILPNIKKIGVGRNRFSGLIPTSIRNASGLQLFDIGENYFEGQVPNLGMLRDLSALNIEVNNLGSNSSNDLDFLKSLVNCSQLNILSVSHNNFGGQLPNFIGNLSIQLNRLYLYHNQIYGVIPKELGNLNNLILLNIGFNYLTGIIPATFGKFGKIQVLDLRGNKLSREIPAFIGNLSDLFFLDLSQNMFIGNIPSTIGNCKSLQWLNLSRNNLNGAIPGQLIIGLSSLLIMLDLSHNSFFGGFPAAVGMLKNMNILDLSQNNLSSNILETIGQCESLEYLYLQGNSFHGVIPPSLASLRGLRRLDLSQNNLSGLIPEGLQNIPTLEYFNASFNMLEGEVPITGIFHNVTAVSLIGNSKLCGGVQELKLPPCPSKAKRKRRHHNIKLTMFIVCSLVLLLLLSFIFTIFQKRKRHRKESTNSTIDLLPMVSYQSLHNATNGFPSQNLIGTGSLGFVYKGSLNSEEKVVAIKVLSHQKKGAQKSFIAECNALRNIRHRNLVKIITCCSSVDYNGNEFKALVFEYMLNGSLEKWLHPDKEAVEQPKTLNLEKRFEIMMDVAFALNYLHYECEQPIVHCDLKPSNVLLDDDMVAHVSDFGLATILSAIDGNSYKETSTSAVKGTIGYAPPEYGMSSQVSTEGDMYSYGILLLEMLTGKSPTEGIFKDGHNLHNYVKFALPNNILEIVDASLFLVGNEYPEIAREEENNISEVTYQLHQNIENWLFSLFRIGLTCSVESPRERMNMMEVIKELNIIKKSFVV